MCTSSLQYVQLAGIVTHQIYLLDCFRVYCMVFSELFLMDFLIHGVCCTILHIV